MAELLEWMMHADQMLGELISRYGSLVYLFLFLIIFIETGLVVIAFFPGDGLLFSAGLFAASGSLELAILLPLLSIATIAGNTSNYFIGKYLGHRFFQRKDTVWAQQLQKARRYHERYGPWAVALSRFFPFMRTLAPFVAGLTRMPGVGRKTAERLIVEMKDRLAEWGGDMVLSDEAVSVPAGASAQPLSQEAETALIALGYKPAEATRMIAQVLKANPELTRSEELIRQALRSKASS